MLQSEISTTTEVPRSKMNEEYWDILKPLSYNCLWNFILGMRGGGKTYGSLKYCIEQYLKHKKNGETWQFLYVRRMGTELDKLTQMRGGRLFKAVEKEFPTHQLKAESNILYCDKEVIGYAQPLSTASILKSDAFPDVKMIIFDEFIIDNRGVYHYLKDEVTKFLDLYETIARERDVTVMFLSNAVTVTNPYFDYFHLDKPANGDIQRFGKAKQILVQNFISKELSLRKHHSRFGRIIEGTEYSDYAYDNEWLLDNMDFIEHKTSRSRYYMTLRYKDTWIGIWFDDVQWLYFVSNDVDLQYGHVYSVTTDDHKPNVMLFKAGRKLPWLKNLQDAYEAGAVRYENMKLKNNFRDIMRMSNNA